MSGKDERNPTLWLPTRARKKELSCPLGIRALSRKENLFMFWCFIPYNKSFIDQACSVNMAGYWLRSFCVFMDRDEVGVHKHAKKELG